MTHYPAGLITGLEYLIVLDLIFLTLIFLNYVHISMSFKPVIGLGHEDLSGQVCLFQRFILDIESTCTMMM